MLTIFALASGRSGTHFLYELLRRNSRGCICRHETYSFANPSMFGRPIADCATGNLDAVRQQVRIKACWIARQRGAAYIETSHAFLKSWFEVAPEFFPDLTLVHLVRNVLEVAKSEANREELIHRWRLPFRYAQAGDGTRFFRWALTGREPIFRHFDGLTLTRFQWYVVQWIEIENRAQRMLDRFALHERCLSLHSPHDLNDPVQVVRLLEFLELPRARTLTIAGGRNRTRGPRGNRPPAAAGVGDFPSNAVCGAALVIDLPRLTAASGKPGFHSPGRLFQIFVITPLDVVGYGTQNRRSKKLRKLFPIPCNRRQSASITSPSADGKPDN